jgi:hypothetical protein
VQRVQNDFLSNCKFLKTEIMRNLSTKGLRMSQAQSIRNMCDQHSQSLSDRLNAVNIVDKSITIGSETHELQEALPLHADKLSDFKKLESERNVE